MKKEWIKTTFGKIAENITDRIDKPSESGLEDYIGLDQLDTDQIRIKRFASTSDVEATKFLCKKGDVIFGKRNAYLRKVGVSDRDAVVSAHSMVLRPTGNLIYPDFLPCLLQSSTFWKVAFSISEGSMSPTIKWKTLAKQEFVIPPIEEQKKIAELLWAIEDNIEKTESLIAINEKLKKGLLNELLTKGIGHKKFKKTEIGEIPEDWKFVELVNFVSPDYDSFFDGDWILSEDLKTGKDVRVIQLGDIGKGEFLDKSCKFISEERFQKLGCLLLEEGDIVISRMAEPICRSFIVPKHTKKWITSVDVAITRINDKHNLNTYFNYLMNSDMMIGLAIKYAIGTTRTRISKKNLQKIKIPLPPLKEQQLIVNKMRPIEISLISLKTDLNENNKLKKKLTDELLKGSLKLK